MLRETVDCFMRWALVQRSLFDSEEKQNSWGEVAVGEEEEEQEKDNAETLRARRGAEIRKADGGVPPSIFCGVWKLLNWWGMAFWGEAESGWRLEVEQE